MRLQYGPFRRSYILRWLRCYESLLLSAVADLEQPLGNLRLLNDAERDELVIGGNRTELPYPRNALVHQLFEEQAARHPSRVALVYRGEQLSYAELTAAPTGWQIFCSITGSLRMA